MDNPRTAKVYRGIGTLYNVGTIGNLGDGQLLERFATERGEGAELAFAVLVERHGPMVLRVCRSMLSDWHDTEDAFQTTFLVLLKKGRGLWVRDSLGPWLHQVAVRTARAARKAAALRRRCEEQAATSEMEEPQVDSNEVALVLHEEIERLPERFRRPLVLCDLEECSHQQAARHLGWPIGTVKSRLARGRKRLRARLTRRGLVPNAGIMLAAARHDASLALRLPALIDSTARAAGHFASARAIASGSMAALTHSVLRTMIVSRWLKAAIIAGVVATAGASGGLLVMHGGQRPGDPERPGLATAPASQEKQVDPFPEGTITKIGFIGTDRAAEQLESKLLSRVGQPLNREKLAADLKSLLATKWFAGATYWIDETPPKSKRWTLIFAINDLSFATTAQLGKLKSLISEPGLVVRADTLYGICEVDGQSVISWILPDKSAVKRGDLVCQLDSGPLKSQLKKQAETIKTADSVVQSAQVAKNAAQRALNDYTASGAVSQQNVLKALQDHLEDQQANERAKLAALATDKATAAKLERQIARCDLRAPADGVIYHANEPLRAFNNRISIATGAKVRERQIIFKMPNIKSGLRVATHLPKWGVNRLDGNRKVRILPGGGPGRVLSGKISEINDLPDPISYFNPGPRVHTTKITIDDPPPELVTDMKVRVEIDVATLENVLIVPATAVISAQGTDRVAVKHPSGKIEWRDVTLGLADGASIEVKKGITTGEAVVVEAAKLLPKEEAHSMIVN